MNVKQYTSITVTGENIIDIEIIRSKRARRISLRADQYGISALAPDSMHYHEVEKFIQSNREWISRRSIVLDKHTKGLDSRLIQKNKVILLGSPFDLQMVKDKRSYVVVSYNLNKFTVHSPDKRSFRKAILSFYYKETSRIVEDRLQFLSSSLNLKHFNHFSIKYQKSRWGSCSFRRNLNFNVMLYALPHTVIDYVIIHELVHLLELNHSKKFWEIVRLNHPGYMEDKIWLRKYGPFIHIP